MSYSGDKTEPSRGSKPFEHARLEVSNRQMKDSSGLFRQPATKDDNDALDFGSAAELYGRKNLLAQGLKDIGEKPALQAQQIADIAYKLGHNQAKRWLDDPNGPGKCNLFLDATLRKSGIHLPWTANEIPSVHGMRLKLEADKAHFDCYKFEPGRTDKEFLQLQPGDIVIWDQTNHYKGAEYPLEHCGVMGRDGIIHYAGSKETNGYKFQPLFYFTRSGFYGSPIAIFRPKNLKYD